MLISMIFTVAAIVGSVRYGKARSECVSLRGEVSAGNDVGPWATWLHAVSGVLLKVSTSLCTALVVLPMTRVRRRMIKHTAAETPL